MSAKLGEILIRAQLITQQQLKEALDYQRVNGGKLGLTLVKLGLVTDEQITQALSRQYGVPSVDLSKVEPDQNVIRLIPREVAIKHCVLPVSRQEMILRLAMSDPSNFYAMDDIKFITGFNIESVVASEHSIMDAIERAYSGTKGLELAKALNADASFVSPGGMGAALGTAAAPEAEQVQKLTLDDLSGVSSNFGAAFDDMDEDSASSLEVMEDQEEIDLGLLERSSGEAPVVRLVNMILVESLRRGASDIHIEPYEKEFRVRFRIDGVLYNIMAPPLKMKDPLTSRLKIMSKLDISEKRLPQDGRIKIKVKLDDRARELDFRVSTLPTLFGEKVVLRLLDKEKLMLDMTKLGFEQSSLDRFKRNIAKPFGMVLVTGPTGSGKTNTLYSALQSLNTVDTNIMTAEDPVEFNLAGINQVNIRDQIGLNFAAALRSFLRQDPNIILVGEIRDFETAEIAIKAALTGHLVLSTLHTNDAPSTVSRLMNMGIEPFLVATSVNIIQAQRLIRRICKECKIETHTPPEALMDLGFSEEDAKALKTYKGKGCQTCNGTGFKGRVGLYEVMEISEALRELILIGGTVTELRRQAVEDGMLTLRMSGIEKVRQGITTIEEVLKETVK
jgi:type IV pilus assembly protein PilB